MTTTINDQGFVALMERLARAWSAQDTDSAVACFTFNAVYMQPPDIQFYSGHAELRAYFAALRPGTYLQYHNLWFDETRQVGCVEFSFGVEGRPRADHGLIIVELRDALISHWREYVQKGPADFSEFIASDGKTWQWHIGNYP
jgi:hypothetical protein